MMGTPEAVETLRSLILRYDILIGAGGEKRGLVVTQKHIEAISSLLDGGPGATELDEVRRQRDEVRDLARRLVEGAEYVQHVASAAMDALESDSELDVRRQVFERIQDLYEPKAFFGDQGPLIEARVSGLLEE